MAQDDQQDTESLRELAGRIVTLLGERPAGGTLQEYEQAHREPLYLQGWLRHMSVHWVADPRKAGPLVTPDQWRLLFTPLGARFNMDLLFVTVMQALAAQDSPTWMPSEPA